MKKIFFPVMALLLVSACIFVTGTWWMHEQQETLQKSRSELAVSLEISRKKMRLAFNRRTEFLKNQFPTARLNESWKNALGQLRGLSFERQSDFDRYDLVQNQIADELAQEIIHRRQAQQKNPNHDAWVKTLQEFDRDSEMARDSYVRLAHSGRKLNLQIPNFRTESLISQDEDVL